MDLKSKADSLSKRTEIGIIPLDWEVKKLEDICEVTSSKRIYFSDYVKSGIPFFRSKEIIEKSQNRTISTELFISEKKFRKIKEKYGAPKFGDILLSAVGARSGIPYYVTDKNDFYFKDGNLVWFKNFSKTIFSKFLFHYLRSDVGQHYLEVQMIGSAQGALTIDGLKQMLIKIPPPREQYAIAEMLSIIDEKIRLNCQMNETLEAVGAAVFRRWFVDFEFPDEEGKPYKSTGGEVTVSELGEKPITWHFLKIGNVLKTVLGGTPKREINEYWENGDIPWINSGKINEFPIIEPTDYITKEGLENSAAKIMPKRTTVLAVTGATLGKVSLLEIESCGTQNVIGILGSNKLPSEYVYFWTKHIIDKITSAKTGGAQQHINKGIVNDAPILIPAEPVMNKYLNIVRPFFNRITLNCYENKRLMEIRDSLLPKLMSGKIRIPVAEDILEVF